MKNFSLYFIFFVFFLSMANASEYSGKWHTVGKITDKCDFIGNALLNVNYNVLKIKVQKWRWRDSNKYKKKLFKGKIRRNNTDIYMQSQSLGYKHMLKGVIENDKISLTFSSSHTDMNEKFGGCTFEFVKD